MAAIIDVDTLVALRRRAVVVCVSSAGNPPEHGIPGSVWADVEADFSAPQAGLPHTVPEDPRSLFLRLGVTSKKPLVLYSAHEPGPAARVWWLARVAGFPNAAVLDGGVQAWQESGREVAPIERAECGAGTGASISGEDTPVEWERLADAPAVREALTSYNSFVVDVRSAQRFQGTGSEPLTGVRAGHIPGSFNLPVSRLLRVTEAGGWRLRDVDELRDVFEPIIGPAGAVTFLSGTALDACVGALAANVAGYGDVQVYEGSWAEWGWAHNDLQDFPVATGPSGEPR